MVGCCSIDLALTVPGAHEGHGAQTGDMNPLYWRPGQRSEITIGGNRPNANYFLLDGVTNTDPTFNTQNFSPSPDAVQEFQVQTGSYSAEMGGAGGGQINIITKSGSSRFHGTGYEFLRNSAPWTHGPGTKCPAPPIWCRIISAPHWVDLSLERRRSSLPTMRGSARPWLRLDRHSPQCYRSRRRFHPERSHRFRSVQLPGES
jgi:TonB-dependent Receptor Plug Domain